MPWIVNPKEEGAKLADQDTKVLSEDDYGKKLDQGRLHLTDAKKRGKEEISVHYDFTIPEDMRGILVKDKFYLILTYGCQMNEHDTETMMGIFEAMGYESTEDKLVADVILLNTCAVRENAEDKVFGELGHLKALKLQNPNLILGVCGCMSQEEAVVSRIMQKHRFC